MIITTYLHGDPDSILEDVFAEIPNEELSDEIYGKLRYMLYEVKVVLDVDLTTGEYKIINFEEC